MACLADEVVEVWILGVGVSWKKTSGKRECRSARRIPVMPQAHKYPLPLPMHPLRVRVFALHFAKTSIVAYYITGAPLCLRGRATREKSRYKGLRSHASNATHLPRADPQYPEQD